MHCARDSILLWASVMVALSMPLESVAHQVEHEVARAEAIVIMLRYADGAPFANEACEIRVVGEETPLLAGRTDANGRIAFVAPATGRYEVLALSHDGHGVQFEFDSDAAEALVASRSSVASSLRGTLQLVVGVVLILALFASVRILARSRSEGSKS